MTRHTRDFSIADIVKAGLVVAAGAVAGAAGWDYARAEGKVNQEDVKKMGQDYKAFLRGTEPDQKLWAGRYVLNSLDDATDLKYDTRLPVVPVEAGETKTLEVEGTYFQRHGNKAAFPKIAVLGEQRWDLKDSSTPRYDAATEETLGTFKASLTFTAPKETGVHFLWLVGGAYANGNDAEGNAWAAQDYLASLTPCSLGHAPQYGDGNDVRAFGKDEARRALQSGMLLVHEGWHGQSAEDAKAYTGIAAFPIAIVVGGKVEQPSKGKGLTGPKEH
ncbi:MAG TPA: hypothetical protein VJH88_02930 [Candidatus Nanoarchaeia archaeon]|nr:hypothetical protein [Candidatus Nanoarchaeia archaeon]